MFLNFLGYDKLRTVLYYGLIVLGYMQLGHPCVLTWPYALCSHVFILAFLHGPMPYAAMSSFLCLYIVLYLMQPCFHSCVFTWFNALGSHAHHYLGTYMTFGCMQPDLHSCIAWGHMPYAVGELHFVARAVFSWTHPGVVCLRGGEC